MQTAEIHPAPSPTIVDVEGQPLSVGDVVYAAGFGWHTVHEIVTDGLDTGKYIGRRLDGVREDYDDLPMIPGKCLKHSRSGMRAGALQGRRAH